MKTKNRRDGERIGKRTARKIVNRLKRGDSRVTLEELERWVGRRTTTAKHLVRKAK